MMGYKENTQGMQKFRKTTQRILMKKYTLFGTVSIHVFTIILILSGIVLSSYGMLSRKVPLTFANGSNSITKGTDTDFNQGTLSSTVVSGTGSAAVVQLTGTGGPGNTRYFIPVTINNTGNSSTLTNYQVEVTVNTAALITAGKMESNCADIRFQDSDQSTNITNYWVENCNNSATHIWVKVPSIPASSSKTLYMYYGNSSDTSQSNGSSTFTQFGDPVLHFHQVSLPLISVLQEAARYPEGYCLLVT